MSRTAQVTGGLLLILIIAMIAVGWRLYDRSNRNDRHGSLGLQVIDALDHRQLQKANQLLNQGADVTTKEHYSGRTCLMAAAASGDEEIVKRLIRSGANVDVVD